MAKAVRRTIPTILLVSTLISPIFGRVRFATYSEVRDILTTLAGILPPALKDGRDATEAMWTGWIADHDREVRARLERGDEDTIVNWLRFGTSFTTKPRATVAGAEGSPPADLSRLLADRIHDLTEALAAPGQDERRLFAKQLFERKGFRLNAAEGRARLEAHLAAEVARVAEEQASYTRELNAARRLPDASEQFARRSRIYRERGLSLDTSIAPGFALEEALRRMLADGAIERGRVRRVAVIGPGLDFTDKAAGFDAYPQQTLQPFALVDSLLRLGLADPAAATEIVTFDISPRVNDHLTRASTRAKAGASYVLRLPLDLSVRWEPGLLEYWRRIGDRIGVERRDGKPTPLGKGIETRTVGVRPSVVLRLVPESLNIIAERYEGPAFDLVVATNVFVYYDTLDQSLAMAAVESMLRPGGFLLSNNALLELPMSRMKSAGYMTVQYSNRPDDGDHIVWYRRVP